MWTVFVIAPRSGKESGSATGIGIATSIRETILALNVSFCTVYLTERFGSEADKSRVRFRPKHIFNL